MMTNESNELQFIFYSIYYRSIISRHWHGYHYKRFVNKTWEINKVTPDNKSVVVLS